MFQGKDLTHALICSCGIRRKSSGSLITKNRKQPANPNGSLGQPSDFTPILLRLFMPSSKGRNPSINDVLKLAFTSEADSRWLNEITFNVTREL
ncbi:unnamed protein product [Ceratitis capitata]|uniref:(Mediterranean fruit fly) hypothetical protein n=1 Tax=Ceratitis capitata TaxID=7213 RepID=A0A811V743_CERCA|nr:unnamed protein product [Ceratitis capitata]